MSGYKQPCIHCNTFIEADARVCIGCGSTSPFGFSCPECLKPIERGQQRCSCCTRSLYVICPHCSKPTFVQDTCEKCGKSLMIQCENKRCGQWQFFQNTKCTACGKKIKGKWKGE